MFSVELHEAVVGMQRRDQVISTIEDEYDYGWISISKIRPDSKDIKRVKGFVQKAKANDGTTDGGTIVSLAVRMAKSIKDIHKALRRGAACELALSDNAVRMSMQDASEAFYSRAIQLAGGPSPQYPSAKGAPAKKLKPKVAPPPIPKRLLPSGASEWELFSDMKGAKAVARGLTSVLGNVMKSMGSALVVATTPKARGKAAQNAAKRMEKALSKKSDYGASDTEPRYQARWRLRSYAALVLDTQEPSIQFEYPEIYNGLDWI